MMFVSTCFVVHAKEISINLNGFVIYVDAGHGGNDNGAHNGDVLEDSINLSISKFLIHELVDKGAYVYSSRDGDYDLADKYDKNRKSKDLNNRVSLINNLKPDLFISLHLNTFQSTNVKGGQVFFQDNEDSKEFADILQEKFNELSGKNKVAKLGEYFLLEKADSIGVIVECGFLTNEEDLRSLVKEEYQYKISKLITKSIFEYFTKKT